TGGPGIEDLAAGDVRARLLLLWLLRLLWLLLRLGLLRLAVRTRTAAGARRTPTARQRHAHLLLRERAEAHLVVGEARVLEGEHHVLAAAGARHLERRVAEQRAVRAPHLDAVGIAHDADRRRRRGLLGLWRGLGLGGLRLRLGRRLLGDGGLGGGLLDQRRRRLGRLL